MTNSGFAVVLHDINWELRDLNVTMMDSNRFSVQRRQAGQPLTQPHHFNLAASPSPNAVNYPIPSAPSPLGSDLGNTPTPPSFQTELKVAIPRLQRLGSKHSSPGSDRQRVSHACRMCRQRKSKCDGVQPSCGRCRDQEIECHYEAGKREMLKQNARTMAAKVERYESLLKQLLPAQDLSRQQDIRNALAEASGELPPGCEQMLWTGLAARRYRLRLCANAQDGSLAIDDDNSLSAMTSLKYEDYAQHNGTGHMGPAGYGHMG
ncbi:predicted protein [Uncinocarpus reesii 1704]|uniref:Zn(2)-C6 fungal-type domain-containing protein n=1 Tax=Uncinocarpus reesii (strain UAMH 1704) TaxID=336963 RepID=C4JY75_UNCRE|nr:uncharacterized protein UREG_07126 [Uncinocarpus reesii 1704]EEP82261.1 predicted protein [Uncinocarpus reesii 1704]